ncbi:MAG: helix-turn-helix transcriptional regulator [Lentisphaeria bacterium]|nr:helix-turn-helix transcriptional regulator [Lentisphaeria bacterium]
MTEWEILLDCLDRALKMRFSRITAAEISLPPPDWRNPLTFYVGIGISIPLSGVQPQYFYRNGKWQHFVCHPGEVMLFPKMCYIGNSNEQYETENFGLVLHPGFLRLIYGGRNIPGYANGLIAHVHLSNSLRSSTRALIELLSLLAQSGDPDDMALQILTLLLRAVRSDLQASGSEHGEISDDLFWKICFFISDNFMTIGTRGEVAEHFHISEVYLSKLFQRCGNGETFNEYLNHIRLEAAVQLLRYSDLSCHELARRCGYASTSYFIRRFKKHFRCTPLDYRKKHEN